VPLTLARRHRRLQEETLRSQVFTRCARKLLWRKS